jgi:hypothetical protein
MKAFTEDDLVCLLRATLHGRKFEGFRVYSLDYTNDQPRQGVRLHAWIEQPADDGSGGFFGDHFEITIQRKQR